MNKNLSELLKQVFNATDEQLSNLEAAMKSNNIFTASQENLDIRYDKVKQENAAILQERDAANNTIAELKAAAKGQADMQNIISNHEQTIAKLTSELEKTKIDSAIRVALMSENAVDVDYLTYKLNEKLKGDNETLTLDDNGHIKDWANKLEGLKTQFPTMFEAGKGTGNDYEVVDPLALRKGKGTDAPTPEAFKNMTYEQRVELKKQNENLYRQLRNNNNGTE